MADLARARLTQERKDLAKDKPFGFYAKPMRRPDGSTDLMRWEAGIVPKDTSPYALPAGSTYRVRLEFPQDYPSKAPHAIFDPPIFHTNVFSSGSVCLSLLLEAGHHRGTVDSHWTPATTIRHVLLALQTFLDEPNPKSVANPEACNLCSKDRAAYDARARKEAAGYEAALAARRKAEEAAEARAAAAAAAAAAGKK
jgi:ubiquitin-conjugating enzyme E2 I